MNHTQRIAHVARQRRSLTKAVVREAVERYLETLAEEIACGEWVDIPCIGKIQVVKEEGKGFVTSITSGGRRVRRPVKIRLRTKLRLYAKFKLRCKNNTDAVDPKTCELTKKLFSVEGGRLDLMSGVLDQPIES